MAINTTGFTQAKTIYVDFDQERKPSLRDIGSDQIGANGAKLISFGFGSESLAGYTVVLETKRVADGGLRYAIAETYTDNATTRYKVPLTDWFTMYRSQLVMAVKVFNNSGVTVVDGEITTVDNDYLISVSDTFTLTVNYAPKATAVVPSFSPSELELILSAISGKQDTGNGVVVLQETDNLPNVSDGTKNGWTYLKKDYEGFFRVYQVHGSTLYPMDITVNRIRLDTSYTQLPIDIGEMVWSQERRTYLLKVTDEVFLEYGQELVFDSKASGTVNNGCPVFFVEPQGDHAISKMANAEDLIANPYLLRGIATETVANNEFFKATQLGRVDGIDTSNFVTENGGTILYFDIEETGTGAYNMTTIKPSKPNPVIKMGSIEKFSTGGASNGRIIVRIDYGESLQTLHDVDIDGAVTGDILRKTNGVWHNVSDLTDAEADIVSLETEVANIKSGTTIVKKAEQDKNGNDIVDTYATKADTYTKTEVDNKVASVYKYKGSVNTFDDLPTTGLTTGDVYNVIDSGINFAWTGSEWDDIGGVEALATASNNGLMSKEDYSKLLALYDKAMLDGLLGGKVDKTTTVNGKALSGNITLVKADVGLGNVDNTSDLNKPISTATQGALDLKANASALTTVETESKNRDLELGARLSLIEETNRKIVNGDSTITVSDTEVISLGKDVATNGAMRVLANGNTLQATQLVVNSDFSNGTTDWYFTKNYTSFTVENGTAKVQIITAGGTATSINIYKPFASLTPVVGKTYYASIKVKSNVDTAKCYFGFGKSNVANTTVSTSWRRCSNAYTADNSNVYLLIYFTENYDVGNIYYIDDVLLYDIDEFKNAGVVNDNGTLFSRLTNDEIKDQMDFWVANGTLPNDNIQSMSGTKRYKAVGKNLFDKTKFVASYGYKIPIKPSTAIVWSVSSAYKVYDVNKVEIASGTNTTITPSATARYIAFDTIANLDIFQLELGSTATTYEPFVSSELYLNGGTLNRLPNSTLDQQVHRNGKYYQVKRIQSVAVVGVVAVNTTNYPLAKNGGSFINYKADGTTDVGVIGTNSTTASGTLLYELATPIETELTPIGNILGFSKGMVYVENIIRKASVYTTNITVTTPIVELDKIIKLNADGSQTELAVSGATIASGGLSFTHSGLASGSLVLFTYKYDNKLYGRIDITYYDAKDGLLGGKVDKTTTVNGKALSGNVVLTGEDIAVSSTDGDTIDYKFAELSQEINDLGGAKLVSTTWLALKTLRDSGTLIAGQQYRITDYECTTVQANTRSAGHPFDIIVTADSANKLNENARACLHEGDTYFANSKLEAWKLKYCLDNDEARFGWAQNEFAGCLVLSVSGPIPVLYAPIGTVFEVGTQLYTDIECSILSSVTVYSIDETTGNPTYYQYDTVFVLSPTTLLPQSGGKGVIYQMIDEFNNDVPYDFKNIQFKKASVWYYTFTDDLVGNSHGNKINVYTVNKKVTLNAITFGEGCYSNTFGNNCTSNTFGNNCNSNTFGNDCYNNNFGNNCSHNAFGDYCYYKTFGNDCNSNTFGDSCFNNNFGNSCSHNAFGDYCHHKTFGNDCNSNAFGDYCYYNTFGNNCNSNTFGNSCSDNTFGNDCYNNTFGNDCFYLRISDASSTQKRYISVDDGTRGASSANKFDLYDSAILNKDYQVTFKKSASGKYLMLWATDTGTMTGKYKSNNTDNTWEDIE